MFNFQILGKEIGPKDRSSWPVHLKSPEKAVSDEKQSSTSPLALRKNNSDVIVPEAVREHLVIDRL